MKTVFGPVAVLALCAGCITAALAAQPAPAVGAKGGTAHAKGASKTVAGQKKQGNLGATGSTSHALRWLSIKNSAHSKEDATVPHLQTPAPATGGKKDSAGTAGVANLHKLPTGTSGPPLAIATTRNEARISGTGMLAKGAVAAVIRPSPKNHGTISGTGITRGN